MISSLMLALHFGVSTSEPTSKTEHLKGSFSSKWISLTYLVTISKLGVDRKSRYDYFNAQSAIRGLRTDYIRYWHVVRSLKL